jgi:ATP-dependent helicase/DNAse subunit B
LLLGGDGQRDGALASERYALYAAVSRPEELLMLSWHAASDDGVAEARSLFVDDVVDLFEWLEERRVSRPLGAVDRLADEVRPATRLQPLSDEALKAELREHVWSASSLEVWTQCPVKWFVQRMLRAEDLEPDPEPLARGGLAHAVLKDTLEGLRERTGSARMTPATLRLAKELLREALGRRTMESPLSAAPERRPGLRR